MRKVKHGTPIHEGPGLCASCRNATIVTGLAESETFTVCGKLDRPYDLIRFKVRECTDYDNRSAPSLSAMKDIAWTLATDKEGRRIGFLSPGEVRRRVKTGELPSDDRVVIDPLTGEQVY